MTIPSAGLSGRNTRGFTLIEMVLVLAVIALLIGAGVTHLVGVNRVAKIRTTSMKLTGLNASVELYQLGCGRLPTQAQGLRALLEKPTQAPVPAQWMRQVKSEVSLIDAWGNPFEYRTPGPEGAAYEVFSLGVDGIESGDDIRL